MPNHVYRKFAPDEITKTRVHAQPSVVVESSTAGWTGNTNRGDNSLSLYGDVRSRSDVFSGSSVGIQVYPIDFVDTNSIDKVIGVPGEYPATGSINFVYVTNTERPNANAVTDTRWYEEHWAPINILSDWYHNHKRPSYPQLGDLPNTFTALHVPEMFYGRQIATGSVFIWTNAWQTASGSNFASGTRYYVDDGNGRLFDVPSGVFWKDAWMSGSATLVGNVFYSEGLVVFTNNHASWHNEFFSASFPATGSETTLHFEFSGSTLLQSMVFMCRMQPGEVNASNNTTWSTLDQTNNKRYANFTGDAAKTYVTAIGIYDEERQLVAVAKLAQPIRKREQDNLDIRLRFDI